MRKLLTFLIALSANVVAVVSPASAQQSWMMLGAGSSKSPAASGGGFALTLGGTAGNNSPTGTISYGTLSYPSGATRIIVCAQWLPVSTTPLQASRSVVLR